MPEDGTVIHVDALLRSIVDREQVAVALHEPIDGGRDIRYIYTNPAYEALKPGVGMVGRTYREVWPEVADQVLPLVAEVLETGKPWSATDLPLELEPRPGVRETHYFTFEVWRIVEGETCLIAATATDTTEAWRREADRGLIADVAHDLTVLTERKAIIDTVGKRLGEYLGAANVLFAVVDEAEGTSTVTTGWSNGEIPDVTGVYPHSEFVTEEFDRAARAGETVVIEDTQTDPRTDAAAYGALNIHSFVTAPWGREGRWRYLFTVNDSKPRRWRADEIELIEEVTAHIVPAVERAVAEESLRESEATLSRAERVAHAGTFRWNVQTGELYWSDGLYLIYGLDRATFVPTMEAFAGFVHPDDQELLNRTIADLIGGRVSPDFDFRIVRGDGSVRTLRVSAQVAEFDEQARPVIVIGANQDVTDRVKAEQALRESEEHYSEIFESVAEGIAQYAGVYGAQGELVDLRVLDINSLGATLSGVSREEQVGKTWLEVFPGLDTRLFAQYQRAQETGEPLHFVDEDNPITHGSYDVTVVPLPNGEFLATYADVTDRAVVQKELETTRFLLEAADELNKWTDLDSLLDRLADIAVRATRHGRIHVATLSDDRSNVTFRATRGESAFPSGGILPFDQLSTSTQEALITGRTKVSEYSRLPEEERGPADAYKGQRALIVPITFEERVLGHIAFDDPGEASEFTDRETAILEGIASQAGVAIENARLFEAARESESRFRATFDHAAVGIVLGDLDGCVVESNQKFDTMLGCVPGEARGRPVSDFTFPEELLKDERLMKQMLAGEIDHYTIEEKRYVRADGGIVFGTTSAALVRDAAGLPAFTITVVEDITERIRAAEAMAEKDSAIRQAYVDVIDAATGGKLILVTPDEIMESLGQARLGPSRVAGPQDMQSARNKLQKMLEKWHPRDLDSLVLASSEALTNAVKHGRDAQWSVRSRNGYVEVLVTDKGPGIDFKTLPKATLVPGFSTKSSLGMGFSIMLDVCDRVLLATEPGFTAIVLEMSVQTDSATAQGREVQAD